MPDEKYILKKSEIENFEGTAKQHFLNENARRTNKSLGDLTGLTGFGFLLIDVPPGCESTEFHAHYHEDECTYVLSGKGTVTIGENTYNIEGGDFIGYRARGLPHTMKNTGDVPLKCIVVGQRLEHDVGDYPKKGKRIYRNAGLPWSLVDLSDIENPVAGKK
ncbi:MAG: cupin domain-containing protein [Marinoscillum sp.]